MFISFFELFALGTIGFYILLTLISGIFVACIENDKYTAPSIIAVIWAAVYWKSIVNIHPNWQHIGIGALIYIAVGVLWAYFRWHRFVSYKVREYNEGSVSQASHSILVSEIKFSNNKARASAWLAYWPWSMVWNITGDFFTMLFEGLEGVFQRVSDRAIAKVPPPEKKF